MEKMVHNPACEGWKNYIYHLDFFLELILRDSKIMRGEKMEKNRGSENWSKCCSNEPSPL